MNSNMINLHVPAKHLSATLPKVQRGYLTSNNNVTTNRVKQKSYLEISIHESQSLRLILVEIDGRAGIV